MAKRKQIDPDCMTILPAWFFEPETARVVVRSAAVIKDGRGQRWDEEHDTALNPLVTIMISKN